MLSVYRAEVCKQAFVHVWKAFYQLSYIFMLQDRH